MKTAVCCIAKMENHYIREFVEWYKRLNFSNVLLYDNNEEMGENFRVVIGDYIDNGFVIYHNLRGLKKDQQQTAYQRCYNTYGNMYDWIAFFDVDEFLDLNEKYHDNINEFLGCDYFTNVDCIRVSWKIYGDNELVRVMNEDYSLVNRFIFPLPDYKQVRWTKAIVKGGLNNFIIPKDNDAIPHMVRIATLKNVVDADGNKNPNTSIRIGCSWNNAALKHYNTKTIEEFVTNKIKKGYALDLDTSILNKEYFFSQNRYTKEKEEIFNNLLTTNKCQNI